LRVRIDPDLCQGHALCCMTAPDMFDVGDDLTAAVIKQPENEVEQNAARLAMMSCPEQAITCEE
jgi:ferredoxin